MTSPNTTANDVWTIGRLLAWTTEHLQSKQVEEPRLSAELLLAHAIGCRRIDLYARFDQEPSTEQRAAFRETIKAAAEHRPIAQLIGHREFYSLDFTVTPDVLIPRPETEVLVEQALAWCRANTQERYDLLDIGTGSGCIAVTLAKRQANLHAVGTDISTAALTVARENAAKHGIAERTRFVEADLIDLPAEVAPPGGFDLILSNPPYVGQREASTLPRNVRDYEPAVALFAGEDGLTIYQRLADGVQTLLRPSGLLLLEIGFGQADAVEHLFAEKSNLTPLARYRDLAGIERVLAFTLAT